MASMADLQGPSFQDRWWSNILLGRVLIGTEGLGVLYPAQHPHEPCSQLRSVSISAPALVAAGGLLGYETKAFGQVNGALMLFQCAALLLRAGGLFVLLAERRKFGISLILR